MSGAFAQKKYNNQIGIKLDVIKIPGSCVRNYRAVSLSNYWKTQFLDLLKFGKFYTMEHCIHGLICFHNIFKEKLRQMMILKNENKFISWSNAKYNVFKINKSVMPMSWGLSG